MVNVNILSDDIVYAKMLMHEVGALFGGEKGKVRISLNQPIAQNANQIPGIFILDLDGKYGGESFFSPFVIGYSSLAESAESKKYSFCKRIFIRPFLIDELLAEVSEMSHLIIGDAPERKVSPEYEKNLDFEADNAVIFCGNKLHLSKNEYDILSLLYGKQGEAVSRGEINEVLGGECGNMCDVYICRLRGKLAELCNERLIYTVRNKGYMLKMK